jgi:RNA 2',3'-cyclic 3'-phosphodiesterase
MRSFVALNLPQHERQRLHDSLAPLRERGLPVRWNPADHLHLTLKFLGDIEGAEIPRIAEALRDLAVRHPPVRLEIGGLGAFPSLRRASIVWIGVAPDAGLLELQRAVELVLTRLGYAREPKPFRPHITLGRTRGSARPPDVERVVATHSWTSTVAVDSLDLMRSHLETAGARYEPLLRMALGAEQRA